MAFVASGKDLMPSSALPLAYYFTAYAAFGGALLVLIIDPTIPGASFYQPRVVALVHLLTLGWLTGSILGSLYIVGPLALRVPMRVDKGDWIAFASFVIGASGMVSHFWLNSYDGMAWSAVLVIGAVTWVAGGVLGGLRKATIAWGVRLHIVLAWLNFLAAAALGMLLGLDHSRGFLSVSPLAAMFAHAHLAAVGWVAMLVFGLAYRLIPMTLPAAMPAGRSLAISAILLEIGLAALVTTLVLESRLVPLAAMILVSGVVAFAAQVRGILKGRLPRPAALPRRDWSTWQVHMAMTWALTAVLIGLTLAFGAGDELRLPLMWAYGVAGLIGFLAQMVIGMQGRLVPLYAWYRVYAATGTAPSLAANALPSAPWARSIFLCWAVAVPLLAWGLPVANHLLIRTGAVLLFAGLSLGAGYVTFMLRRARFLANPYAGDSGARKIPNVLDRMVPSE